MGIPEERLRSDSLSLKMEAKDAKPASQRGEAAEFGKSSSRSPLSALSNTDSDDSVDVRVRSPAQPKYRKRPRAEPRPESDISDGERGGDGFVVPKKRFRREYEAARRLEEREEGVPGCGRHRQVMFECGACLETVARRFGWPPHALLSPPPPLPLPLRLPLPLVDPLAAIRALGGDPRLAAGLLAAQRAPAPRRPSPPAPAPAPAAAAAALQEDTPLDLTRRGSSGSGSGGRFSIENILAGRTAPERRPARLPSPLLSPPPPPAPAGVPARPSAKSSSSSSSSPRRAVLPPHGGERRELANERERMRVKHLTGAFKELSASIGGIASECIGSSGVKFTKVAILRTASLYIGYLSHVLSEGAGPTEERVYDQMRSAILEVMAAKGKKGKEDDDEEDI